MGVGGQHHTPAALHSGKTQYPLYRRLGGPQGRSGRARKISPPTGIRSPDRPARSESLYRLSATGRDESSGELLRNRVNIYFAETSHYGNEGTLMVHLEETKTKCFTIEQQKKQGQLIPRPSAISRVC